MTVNLMHTNAADTDRSQAKAHWNAITEVASDGLVYIDEKTVNAVARLVEGAELTNNQFVTAYPSDDEEYSMPSYVPGFGPGLLSEDTLAKLREILAADDNGQQALAMLDVVIERGLQISLSGKDHIGARLKGVNWIADEVEINRTSSNMSCMFQILGLDGWNEDGHSRNVPLDVFAKAVNDNGASTDMPERLQDFVACARRNNATHVYWA